MRNKMFRKGLVIGIITFLLGVSIITTSSSIVKNHIIKDKIISDNKVFSRYDWWDEDWEYRKQIKINHSMVTADLQNFPILISITSSDFIDHAQYDGDDFVFVIADNSNIYSHEIEYYKSSSGNLVAWVNITSLSSNVNTILYLYYGNPNCSSQQDADNVWDSNYIHVWHIGESLEDSAGSDDGNDHGTTKVTGKIGLARDFEKSEQDYIDFGDMLQPADGSLTTMTWEAWVKPETQDIELMTKYNTFGSNDYKSYVIEFTNNGKFYNYAFKGSGYPIQSLTIDSYSVVGQWIYLTSTWTLGGTNDIDPFIDGIEVSDYQEYSGSSYMSNTPVSDDLGRYRTESGTTYTDAVIDEVRWSKIVRSDAWINTSYNTMNDPSSFFSIGSEEIVNHPPYPPFNPSPAPGATDVGLYTSLTWSCFDPDYDGMFFDVYFGKTSPPPQVVSNQSSPNYDPGTLEFCTKYYWQIVVWDEHGASTFGPIWNFTTRCNDPPDIPIINGPKRGKPGTSYSYTFESADPDGDDVFYQINWGDGTYDDWFGPFESNEITTKEHKWDETGNYTILARSKDEFDAVGNWSFFDIEIPRIRIVSYLWYQWFLERFPMLEKLLGLIRLG